MSRRLNKQSLIGKGIRHFTNTQADERRIDNARTILTMSNNIHCAKLLMGLDAPIAQSIWSFLELAVPFTDVIQ